MAKTRFARDFPRLGPRQKQRRGRSAGCRPREYGPATALRSVPATAAPPVRLVSKGPARPRRTSPREIGETGLRGVVGPVNGSARVGAVDMKASCASIRRPGRADANSNVDENGHWCYLMGIASGSSWICRGGRGYKSADQDKGGIP